MTARSEDAGPGLRFPPLFRGEPTPRGTTAFAHAIGRARSGIDPGLIVHDLGATHLEASLVLAPEVPLGDAMTVLFAAMNGFADSFGSLAPSEVAVHFDWPDAIRLNGARCGRFRAAASTGDAQAEPDWLVIGLELALVPPDGEEPGARPDVTTLQEEGCGHVAPAMLLESWSRHTLVWLHEWLERGPSRLLAHWSPRAFGLHREVRFEVRNRVYEGRFLGLDDKGGMVINIRDLARLLPLTLFLEDT